MTTCLPEAPVRTKRRMYELLAAGAFGNTIPQYFDVGEWERSPDSSRYAWWGVRTLTPGGPCRLNCPREEVRETAERPEFRKAGINVSVMIDKAVDVTLWADVYDSPTGILAYGVENPPKGGSWRALMPSQGREYRGVSARALIERHLNPSSLADLWAVFDRWPGHVLEFSATRQCFGTVPGRNAVVWEVRLY